MGRAVILLDERLLLKLLHLPLGTRVLSSMNYPLAQCVVIGVESDTLPDNEPGVDLPTLSNSIIDVDEHGNQHVRWPDLEPKVSHLELGDYTKNEAS